MISLIYTTNNVTALDTYHFPESISDINNIEYFVEFSPAYGDSSTTNYSISLTHILDSFVHTEIVFNDPQITYAQYDYSYNLNLTDEYWKIQDIIPLVSNYINGEHSELLCNFSEPFKETQYFRVDELITFEPYLNKNSVNLAMKSTSKAFTFIEETIYNRNLKYNINVYRFSTQFTFDGPADSGCG